MSYRTVCAGLLAAAVVPALVGAQSGAPRRYGPAVAAEPLGSAAHWATRAASRAIRSLAKADGGAAAPADARGDAVLVLNLEFDTAASCAAYAVDGAPAFTRIDRFADVFLPVDRIDEVAPKVEKAPGLVRLEVVNRVRAPRPPVAGKAASRGEPDQIVRGGLSGLTGKGVIVAIVDSGLDFRHKDFIRTEGGQPVSRLLFLWDTTSGDFDAGKGGSAAPIRYPNGASVGTVYTQDQLTADLRSSSPSIGDRDLNGHGTSCAGIAAGSGAADRRFVGVAPGADIIAVRVGSTPGAGLDNAWILNAACGWLDSAAGARPLVVSCSFGGQNGQHDGRSIEEQELNARFPDGARGRAICLAAGNEGADPIHAETALGTSAKPAELKWKANDSASLTLIFNTSDLSQVRFRAAEGTKLPALKAKIDAAGKQASVPIDSVPKGDGGMLLFTADGSAVQCDAYIDGGAFDKACVTFSKLVGRPGTAAAPITVGSYDWNDRFDKDGSAVVVSPGGTPMTIGALSSYSSVGPSRDATVTKPDLVAPGQFYSAPVPLNATHGMRNTGGSYQLFNGTSAATPYVAGVVALMLEAKPSLAFGDLKRALHRAASTDTFTGPAPNARWGYGKLDLAAVRKAIADIR